MNTKLVRTSKNMAVSLAILLFLVVPLTGDLVIGQNETQNITGPSTDLVVPVVTVNSSQGSELPLNVSNTSDNTSLNQLYLQPADNTTINASLFRETVKEDLSMGPGIITSNTTNLSSPHPSGAPNNSSISLIPVTTGTVNNFTSGATNNTSIPVNTTVADPLGTPLNSGNMLHDGNGNPFWSINSPGNYYLAVPESNFVTQAQFAIIVGASNVIIDGQGKTISGGTRLSYNSNAYGIWVYPQTGPYTGIQVKNLTIRDKTYGMQINLVSNGRIENVHLNNNWVGLFLTSSSGNTITNVHADDNVMAGMFLSPNCPGNTITLSSASRNIDPVNPADFTTGYGIEILHGSNNNMVTDNIMDSNSQVGLYFYNSSGNFATRNTMSNNYWGVHDDIDANGNTITGNTMHHNVWGITSDPSSFHNTLTSNNVFSNTYGIYVALSPDNDIENNVLTSNTINGIMIYIGALRNKVINNTVSDSQYGLELAANADNNVVRYNKVLNSHVVSMYISGSNDNTIDTNTFVHSDQNGIYLDAGSRRNSISNNIVTGSPIGIEFGASANDNIFNGNRVSGSTVRGLYIIDSTNETIFNNFFNNAANVEIGGAGSVNTFNAPLTTASNILGGPYMGGNYWATPGSTGFSQITPDTNKDGICDSPFTVYPSGPQPNIDQYPLHLPLNYFMTGVYRPGAGFYLHMNNLATTWNTGTDVFTPWDNVRSDIPIAGDWNGDGITETGVYRPGAGFYLHMNNLAPAWNTGTDVFTPWDNVRSDIPIAGDWNGNGITETGVYRPGAGFYLHMNNLAPAWNPSSDLFTNWDNAGADLPIAGDWNSDGVSETGVYRPGTGFYLHLSQNATWNPGTDIFSPWDNGRGDFPIQGHWK